MVLKLSAAPCVPIAQPLPAEETPEAGRSGRGFNFQDERLMGTAWRSEPEAELLEHFVRAMAICHTVIPEGAEAEVQYQAESPDELAFISAAREFGARPAANGNGKLALRDIPAKGAREFLRGCPVTTSKGSAPALARVPAGLRRKPRSSACGWCDLPPSG